MSKIWNSAPLADLALFRSGLWTGKKGPFTTARVLRNTNIRKYGQLSLDDIAEIEVETKQLETRRLKFGDIILERSGGGPKQAVGRAVCFELDGDNFSFSNFTSFIRVQDNSRLSYRFLHLVLNWWYETGVTEKIQSNSTGIRNLDFNAYKALEVPLPPLEEQQRIVAVLDEAFEGLARARAHAEANLQNARELFGSALHVAFKDETVSWNNTALATLGSVVTGSTPKTSDEGNLGDHLPFVTPGDFLPDGSLAYDNRGLSEKGASLSRILPAGSALMVCIGATIGKAGYCDRPIATNQQINAVIPDDHISGEYLYYQMLTPEFQAAVMHGSGQATLPIINKGKWSKLTVRVPNDLTKQAQIVNWLSGLRAQIDTTLAQYKAQIMDIADLRQSLLHKAFSGELT